MSRRHSHLRIASRFNGVPCPYCGTPMTRESIHCHAANYATLEHVVPKSQGGRETIRACRRCNEDKRNLTLTEWRIVLMWRRFRPVIFHYEWVAARSLMWAIFLDAQIFLAYL